ncbi:lipopolysaccharide biosynthesis protein [Devosia algicola]|uniref:Lipopolysaccharide biosynthesis protein n=1 Tax=Devosia algicola TaxID=3026418 RepID=A0ABY7YR88_9HYPH|nr:lipopolysaccharide biosynthesis protein [Devosia algicola]WDR03534.1 lipopolysaccharide biosynthesis protein [Devosia algicola]
MIGSAMAVSDVTAGPDLDHVKTGRAAAAMRGTLWSMLSSFAPAAFGMVVFMASSRVLGPAEFGIVAFAASIATFGMAVAPAGFRDAIIQRATITHRHLDAVFWLCIVSALLVYGVIVAVAGPIAKSFGEPQLGLLIPFIGLRVIFDMVAAVPNGLLVRAMSFRKIAIRTGIASLVAAVGCLTLLWFGFGLWALAFSQLATSIVTCAGALIAARWRPGLNFDLKALRQLRAFGLFSTGNHFISTVSIDQLLIGVLLGPAGLGIYGFARRIFQILTDLITGALNLVSYSLLSSMQQELGKLREAYLFGTFASSIVAFPAFSGLALVAQDLIPFAFGPQWVDAVPVVQAFCALGLLTAVGVLQSSLIKSQGQADLWFYYLVAKQSMTVLYVFLFAGWGVSALTNALVIQNFVMWLPSVYMVVRILRLSPWAYLNSFALPVFATLVMIGVGWLVQTELTGAAPLVRLGVTVGTCALVYAATVLLLGRHKLLEIKATLRRR